MERTKLGMKKRLKLFRQNSPLLLLALPAMLLLLVFNYIPLYGLILPFKEYRIDLGFFESPWAGFENFEYLFTGDAWRITRNTILFNAIFIVVGLIGAVGFALLLFQLTSGFVKLYQTILFIPYFISWVVASYLFLGLLDMDYGYINRLLEMFGQDPIMWYNEPKYWYVILPLANLWKGVGYSTIIYYTQLLGVDPELYEAASLDGAKKWQCVRYISLPMLKPLIVMMTLMSIGSIVKADFGLFYNLTRDSTALYPVTDVIDTYVYRALRQLGDVGMSSAAGFYQSVVGFILVLTSNFVVKKLDPENSLF